MKQQINLYQDQFRPKRVALPAVQMVQLAVAVVGLLLIATLVLAWQGRRQAADFAEQRQLLAAQERELARLEASLPAPKEDPRLRELLGRLERELAAKQSFLTRFDSHSLGETRGFSMYMRGLARRPLPDLWLRRIELTGDGELAFEGSAKSPEAVPIFVRMLTDEQVFQGREFRTLRMSEEDGRVDFDLRSRERKQ